MKIWLTNDPLATRILQNADREYERAIAASSRLTLAEKVKAINHARSRRDENYQLAASLKSDRLGR